MVSEAEVQEVVTDAAARLGIPAPSIAFRPARISFMPVLVMNGTVTVTAAARAALSPAAIEFAVLHGLASDAQGERGRQGRRWGIAIFGLLTGFVVASPVHGPARSLIEIVATIIAIVAFLFASASIQAKWPSRKVDRMILAAQPTLEGAREYDRITDRFNLNGDAPEYWTEPHGKLVDLERLERTAREMGLSTG